jgi:Cu+-exporting ATPase
MNKLKCTHCGLEYDEELMIKDGENFFCCKGCQGVYYLLKDEGLDSFYAKKGDVKLGRPKEVKDEFKKFDRDGFKKRYVKELKNGTCEINLIIEGIHCSACVWLNEKVLHRLDGILEADINFTTHKARIIYDPNGVSLSKIFETIASIGYIAYPYDKKAGEERTQKQRRDYYARLLVGLFSTMNVMWIALAQYAGYFSGIKEEYKNILNIAEFILATPALFYTGGPYFKGAYYGLKNRFINMDFLVITGATLTYIYSIYTMITKSGEVYFDSATMIITFVFIGKFLEVQSKKKAVDTMDSLTSLLPSTVIVLKDGQKIQKDIEEVEVGNILEIRAGEKVVLDSVIVSGEGSFDYSSLTGESKPVFKKKSDEVLSGTVLLDSVVLVEVKKAFSDSTIQKISHMLEEAMNKKPKIERLANEVSGYFSITILSIAFITFLVWMFYLHSGFERALIVGISVIVIACPCALGLATPIATLVGLNQGIKKGILFKESSFLETFAKIDTIFMDKTGTITKAKPKVIKETILKEFDKNLLYSLISSQTHPISKGVKEFLGKKEELKLDSIKNIEAKGIKASFDDKTILAGNKKLLEDEGIEFEKEFESSVLIFAIDGEVVAFYELEDEIREGVKEVIKSFENFGIKVIMLTGDHKKASSKVAQEVGIKKFYHSLFPKDKANIVKEYQDRKKVVAFVGDGINDSVALGLANVSIAMGGGAKIALDVSDIVLLNDDITLVLDAYKISKETYKNIRQNLLISLVYNSITIPLAVIGYVIPLVAALSMSLSSLIVVGNSLRRRVG